MTYGNYPELSSVKKVLIIKLRHLGDVLLSTPVINSIKKVLPEAQIDMYVYDDAQDILSNNRALNQIITYNRSWKKLSFIKKLIKELRLLLFIKKQKYDLVINLTEGDRGAIVAKYSKAPIRVGFDPKDKGFFQKKKIFTHVAKQPQSLRHNVEKNLDALRIIGIFPDEMDKKLVFTPTESSIERVHSLLEENGVEKGNYLVVHPTSRWLFKSWPIEKFQELGRYLTEKGERIIFTGSNDPKEQAFIQKIKEGISEELVLDFSGCLSISDLAALIQMSKLIVTVDSFPLHLAAALSVPTIALFGPTCDKTWGPWMNKDAKVLASLLSCRPCHLDGCGGSKMSDCLQQLSVWQVKRACDQILSEKALLTDLQEKVT